MFPMCLQGKMHSTFPGKNHRLCVSDEAEAVLCLTSCSSVIGSGLPTNLSNLRGSSVATALQGVPTESTGSYPLAQWIVEWITHRLQRPCGCV